MQFSTYATHADRILARLGRSSPSSSRERVLQQQQPKYCMWVKFASQWLPKIYILRQNDGHGLVPCAKYPHNTHDECTYTLYCSLYVFVEDGGGGGYSICVLDCVQFYLFPDLTIFTRVNSKHPRNRRHTTIVMWMNTYHSTCAATFADAVAQSENRFLSKNIISCMRDTEKHAHSYKTHTHTHTHIHFNICTRTPRTTRNPANYSRCRANLCNYSTKQRACRSVSGTKIIRVQTANILRMMVAHSKPPHAHGTCLEGTHAGWILTHGIGVRVSEHLCRVVDANYRCSQYIHVHVF